MLYLHIPIFSQLFFSHKLCPFWKAFSICFIWLLKWPFYLTENFLVWLCGFFVAVEFFCLFVSFFLLFFFLTNLLWKKLDNSIIPISSVMSHTLLKLWNKKPVCGMSNLEENSIRCCSTLKCNPAKAFLEIWQVSASEVQYHQ